MNISKKIIIGATTGILSIGIVTGAIIYNPIQSEADINVEQLKTEIKTELQVDYDKKISDLTTDINSKIATLEGRIKALEDSKANTPNVDNTSQINDINKQIEDIKNKLNYTYIESTRVKPQPSEIPKR